MRQNDDDRQDPFRDLEEEAGEDTAVEPGSEVVPAVLGRRPKGRKNALRPAERRRKRRFVGITFSDEETPDRLRALAEKWGLRTRAGLPNVSRVVEHLLLPQLEAAEKGQVSPPGWT